MKWNDNANVCGQKSEAQVAPKATNPAAPTIVINIDKTKQRMTVLLDGVQRYDWPVSTGKAGYSTPSGTFTCRMAAFESRRKTPPRSTRWSTSPEDHQDTR